MRTQRTMRFSLLALAAIALATAFGCSPGGTEIGPFSITVPATSGTLLRDLFLPKQEVDLQVTRDFCDMPTENEVQGYLTDVSDFDISRFVSISRLELVHTTITATSGGFDVLTRLSLYYVPAGDQGDEVLLGTASSATGFGDIIVLEPDDTVDFLALIRENDQNSSGECPKLRIEVTVNGIPTSDIAYEVDVTLDAYARLGF